MQAFAQRHDARLQLTEHARHAFALATNALADGCKLIVAVGGDGTMNEVATALVGADATLGLVPCGSGDGLGRHLGIHGTPAHALNVLLTGRPRRIDTGFADGHAFFSVAGLGFEAEIAQRFNRLQRRGFFRYLTTSAASFREYTPQHYTIHHDEGTDRVCAFTVAIGNTEQYGNNARVAPGAAVDDGLLDLSAVPRVHAMNAVPLAFRLFTGGLARTPGILMRRSARFVVERATPGLLQTDGEIHAAGARVEFTIRPLSLEIMVPAGRVAAPRS